MSEIFSYIIAIFTLLLVVWCTDQYFRVWRHINKLPGPKTHPIIGNVLQVGFTLEDFLSTLLKWWYTHGCDKYRAWILNQPYVIISNPKDVEVILSSDTLIEKGDFYEFAKPWVGDGLITSTGSKWQKRRKMIAPSFHLSILMDYLETMNRCGDTFIDKLSKYANNEKIFNIPEMASDYTLDVICESALGTSSTSSKNLNTQALSSIQELCELIPQRVVSILKRPDILYKFTSDYRRHEKALSTLRNITSEIIIKRRKLIEEDGNQNETKKHQDSGINMKRKKAFLDNLLTATIDNQPLTFQDMFEEVSTFMVAGYDTVSSAINFGFYILSRFPEIQDKVLEEQRHIFGDDKNRNPTYNELQEMRYMELFIRETLRLFPSAPLIGRFTREHVKLGDILIPPNTTIVMFILAMGRNEKYFKDPLKFDPNRFSAENRENVSHYQSIPFSAGPRNCIGQKFAMLEMKTIFSKVVRKYEILPPYEFCCNETSHNHDVTDKRLDPPRLSLAITLESENGIKIKLKHRKL